MRTEENEAVVRRFMHEVLVNENVDVVGEVLASDYVNVAMEGADRAGVKGIVAAPEAALKSQRFEDDELVAEGDVGFAARFNYFLTLKERTETMAPTLAYHRLTDGR
jgi:hypothetical protein